ncbi:hypothetical protein FIBSPDRAFT_664151, partial [Athelia psychrophila]
KEQKLQEALAEYTREQSKPRESRRGLRAIANQYGIANQYRTILNRYNGGRTISEVHEAQQHLTPAEESILVDFLNESADRGFPQNLHQITNFANLILQNRLGEQFVPIGESWVGRFLDRHRERL